MKIREIKYQRTFEFYLDSNSKTSRFAKLSTCKSGSNFQFAKLNSRKITGFYNALLQCVFEIFAHPVEDLGSVFCWEITNLTWINSWAFPRLRKDIQTTLFMFKRQIS